MSERKRTGRNELRQKVRDLTKERDELVARLTESNAELKLHALWCGLGKPSWLRRQFNAFWARLTFATHAA